MRKHIDTLLGIHIMNRRTLLAAGLIFTLSGCAAFSFRQPLRVMVAGIDTLQGQGMEARFSVRLRIQNHGETPIDYDGIALDLDIRGASFASGVSDQRGTIPRFGETLITVPVSISAAAMLVHALRFATNPSPKTGYQLRGYLAGPSLIGGRRFDSDGEITLPSLPPATQPEKAR